MTNQQDRELGWDDEISKESEFQLLPAGDYDFTVTNFERGRHAGSANLPACNKAIVSIAINSERGKTTLKENFFLHTSTEAFLTEFFTGIGQKEKGKPVRMNWNTVIGSTGRLKLKIRNWTDKNNQPRQNNEVQSYYPKEVTAQQAPPQQQQTYQQPPAQPNNQYQQPPVNQPPQNTNYGQF